MSRLMLIDAAHPEETRVTIVENGQVEDFDFETTGSEQLRGNIYLAKVTRVEPSLQAAFVEYGGNRHGFLAFSEIHPDYYQLPAEDREALLREAAAEAAAAIEDEDDDDDLPDVTADDAKAEADEDDEADDEDDDDEESDDDEDDEEEDESDDESDEDEDEDEASDAELSADSEDAPDHSEDVVAAEPKPRERGGRHKDRNGRGRKGHKGGKRRASAESAGRGEKTRSSITKRYKIQEVIRRRQVMLVQVVKEERGGKGAALTTYLSLAGRYSVLMPNTPRGGGISRKIANGADRKRLKSIVSGLDVPDGQGLIVRTAGAKRTQVDIKRDYDYLSKLWEQIVEKTMTSEAPALINAEGGLVHRAMRDMFDKGIEEVWVEGDAAYREAHDLAELIMPAQARKVQPWAGEDPLFVAEDIERQLDSIYSPIVQLKSGGYLVINQTEALVAIDVNSGKSTKERNIENTALRTNLEAAEEACRQMRLRDLAGLIVIDFIDMEENRNNRLVEKRMKECLKADRARVQHGRVSQFGLMEISRQRRRQGVLQATSCACDVCNGTGRRRTIPSAALQVMRALEARVAQGALKGITVHAPTDVALYILNQKREALIEIERHAGFAVSIHSSTTLLPGDFSIDAERDASEKPKRRTQPRSLMKLPKFESDDEDEYSAADERAMVAVSDDLDDDDDEGGDEAETRNAEDAPAEGGGRNKRKRRKRRRGGRGRENGEARDTGLEVIVADASGAEADAATFIETDTTLSDEDGDDEEDGENGAESELPNADGTPRKRRRRGRRGGRRRRQEGGKLETESGESRSDEPAPEPDTGIEPETEEPAITARVEARAPEPEPEPSPQAQPAPVAEAKPEPSAAPAPKRVGWWNRMSGQ